MPQRVVTGALYLVGWLVFAWLGGWPLTLLIMTLSQIALVELRWVVSRRRMRLAVEAAYPLTLAFIFAAHYFASDTEGYAVALMGLLVGLVLVDFALHLQQGSRAPTANVSLTAFACIYLGFMFGAVVLLRGYQPELIDRTMFGVQWSLGQRLLFFLLGVTMISDVGAYATGKAIGQHRLSQTVSPNKTLEGTVGAVLFAVVGALLLGYLFNVTPLPTAANQAANAAAVGHRIMMGLLLGVFGQIGDFGASIFKREAEVKDYGWLFPGHGGVLDRIDSLIVNAPLLYLYVIIAF